MQTRGAAGHQPMGGLSAEEEHKMSTFMGFTGAPRKEALTQLRKNDWRLESSIILYTVRVLLTLTDHAIVSLRATLSFSLA